MEYIYYIYWVWLNEKVFMPKGETLKGIAIGTPTFTYTFVLGANGPKPVYALYAML